jgi:hypothetical protein
VNGDDKGSLYVCIRLLFPWRRDDVVCRLAERSRSESQSQVFHLLELDRDTLRVTDLDPYLSSQQLGSKLHDLFDLDLDYAKSDVIVCAALTNSQGVNTQFFLMTRPGLPAMGDCTTDVDCVTSANTTTGYVIFPNRYTQQRNAVFYVCAVTSGVSGEPVQVCGDGVVIDDDAPSPGTVAIDNAVSGFLGNRGHALVTWSGFSDVEREVTDLPDDVTVSYTVALGRDNYTVFILKAHINTQARARK